MEHPTPDTKDWTWVLNEPCSDCGFDGPSVSAEGVAAQVRANAATWRNVLKNPKVGERPPVSAGQSPIWSALEYGAHVRDVYALAVERVTLMLKKDSPTFADWDQDATALEGNYSAEDPNKVGYDLAINEA